MSVSSVTRPVFESVSDYRSGVFDSFDRAWADYYFPLGGDGDPRRYATFMEIATTFA